MHAWPSTTRVSLLVMSIALACAASCRTTPAGPLGDPLDLKRFLPAGVTSPPEAETELHQLRVDVGNQPAQVGVAWRTFHQGGKAYILSAAATVHRASDGLTLTGMTAEFSGFPTVPDGPEGVTQSVTLSIEWERNTLTTGSSSSKGVEIRGDGSWK